MFLDEDDSLPLYAAIIRRPLLIDHESMQCTTTTACATTTAASSHQTPNLTDYISYFTVRLATGVLACGLRLLGPLLPPLRKLGQLGGRPGRSSAVLRSCWCCRVFWEELKARGLTALRRSSRSAAAFSAPACASGTIASSCGTWARAEAFQSMRFMFGLQLLHAALRGRLGTISAVSSLESPT